MGAAGPVFFGLLALAGKATVVRAQAPNPSSAANPFFGSVTLRPAVDKTLQISLDEAVKRGLENNLGLKEAENGEKELKGQKTRGSAGVLAHNQRDRIERHLPAQPGCAGFRAGVIGKFARLFPGGVMPAGLSFITRDDLTQGQIHYGQMLFSGPVIAGWKAAGAATRAAHFATMSARGEVVQQVATAYLHAIAAGSEVDNARALLAEDQLLVDHVHAAHLAGTAANLDELRARVQLQAQNQALIAAENARRST